MITTSALRGQAAGGVSFPVQVWDTVFFSMGVFREN
jgi:hypothetical protein